MSKSLTRLSLVQAVRIAHRMADKDPQRNPAYVKALDVVATAFESATISSRQDGDYWLVKIPILNTKEHRQ